VHLRGLVTQLRAIGQPLDYTRLMTDLRDWPDPARLAAVRRRRARSRAPSIDTSARCATPGNCRSFEAIQSAMITAPANASWTPRDGILAGAAAPSATPRLSATSRTSRSWTVGQACRPWQSGASSRRTRRASAPRCSRAAPRRRRCRRRTARLHAGRSGSGCRPRARTSGSSRPGRGSHQRSAPGGAQQRRDVVHERRQRGGCAAADRGHPPGGDLDPRHLAQQQRGP
jgi:hypothetical protein